LTGPNRCCICCHQTDVVAAYAGLLRCSACGHTWADLDLTDEQLFSLYGKDYFFGDEYSDYLADRKVSEKNFALRFDVLRRFLRPEHRRLFEIGSAYGFFLDSVRNRFDVVQGIDVTPDGVRYAREDLHLDVARGDFLEYDLPQTPFDVVCLWDTIEHLRRPDLYVAKAGEHLPSGGLIAITTGDIESVNARMKGAKWRLIHPPTHVHYFSRRSLSALLSRSGFDVVYNKYCGFYRSLDFIVHNMVALRYGMPRVARAVSRLGVGSVDLFANLYDISYVIGVKR
jgi:predicted TPR repeat methyltransferase